MPHPALSTGLMMWPQFLLGALMALAIGVGLSLAWLRGLRALYPTAWSRPAVSGLARAVVLIWWAALLAQPLARLLDAPRPARLVVVTVGGVGLVLLGLTTPFVWLGAWMRRRIERADAATARAPDLDAPSTDANRTPPTAPVDATTTRTPPTAPVDAPPTRPTLTRRELGLLTARAAPAGGALVAAVGAQRGQAPARIWELDMAYPELPAALEGLRILQYSDVHLGYFVDMAEIEALIAQGQRARPDLVVLTGDIADDLPQLPRALELFREIEPRLGVFAAIGNHEYFRGIREARRAYDASKVPLLIEQGTTLDVGGARLHLSGADDPRFLGRQNGDFFARTVATTLDGAPSDAFHVLMSHRPEGFVAAQKAGVQLTLAGHTHGAQVGWGGRSLFEPLLPDKYLWGPYREGDSRLYTSSGAGHWFPFRLGCPREITVIRLVRGPLDAPVTRRLLG